MADELRYLYDRLTPAQRARERTADRLVSRLDRDNEDDEPVTPDRDGELDGVVDPIQIPLVDR